MIRVIGGKARGRRLFTTTRTGFRPTADRIKETLFNLLPGMAGMKFLDLFAGTGNVGYEAISRGAVRVCFVENDPVLVEVLKKNGKVFHCAGDEPEVRFEILQADAERAIGVLQKRCERFDAIFADPPYEKGWIEKTIWALGNGRLLEEDGIIVLQHSMREAIPEETGPLTIVDERKAGDTFLSILKMNRTESDRTCPI